MPKLLDILNERKKIQFTGELSLEVFTSDQQQQGRKELRLLPFFLAGSALSICAIKGKGKREREQLYRSVISALSS